MPRRSEIDKEDSMRRRISSDSDEIISSSAKAGLLSTFEFVSVCCDEVKRARLEIDSGSAVPVWGCCLLRCIFRLG